MGYLYLFVLRESLDGAGCKEMKISFSWIPNGPLELGYFVLLILWSITLAKGQAIWVLVIFLGFSIQFSLDHLDFRLHFGQMLALSVFLWPTNFILWELFIGNGLELNATAFNLWINCHNGWGRIYGPKFKFILPRYNVIVWFYFNTYKNLCLCSLKI